MDLQNIRMWAFERVADRARDDRPRRKDQDDLIVEADQLANFVLSGLPATDLTPEQKLAKVKELVETP